MTLNATHARARLAQCLDFANRREKTQSKGQRNATCPLSRCASLSGGICQLGPTPHPSARLPRGLPGLECDSGIMHSPGDSAGVAELPC